MRLYHGSNGPIESVDISKDRKYKDFGQRFYTKHLRDQAEFWSVRIARRFGGTPTITEFDFNLDDCL